MSKRGAPKGNLNALKHGFYSREFRKGEEADLETILTSGLTDEITMLRVATRRLFELSTNVDHLDMDDIADVLDSLGLACIRIRTLILTQEVLTGSNGPLNSSIAEAFNKVYEELRITE